MAYSEIVYKKGGNNFGPNGTKYSWLGVKSRDEHARLLREGWHDSLISALSLKAEDNPTDDTAEDNSAPSRREVVEKAKELGLDFKFNTPTLKLQKMVEDRIDELDKETVGQ